MTKQWLLLAALGVAGLFVLLQPAAAESSCCPHHCATADASSSDHAPDEGSGTDCGCACHHAVVAVIQMGFTEWVVSMPASAAIGAERSLAEALPRAIEHPPQLG